MLPDDACQSSKPPSVRFEYEFRLQQPGHCPAVLLCSQWLTISVFRTWVGVPFHLGAKGLSFSKTYLRQGSITNTSVVLGSPLVVLESLLWKVGVWKRGGTSSTVLPIHYQVVLQYSPWFDLAVFRTWGLIFSIKPYTAKGFTRSIGTTNTSVVLGSPLCRIRVAPRRIRVIILKANVCRLERCCSPSGCCLDVLRLKKQHRWGGGDES